MLGVPVFRLWVASKSMGSVSIDSLSTASLLSENSIGLDVLIWYSLKGSSNDESEHESDVDGVDVVLVERCDPSEGSK